MRTRIANLLDRSPAMPDNIPALVVVAAGALSTRVHQWVRLIPQECYPGGDTPRIGSLLTEIAAVGPPTSPLSTTRATSSKAAIQIAGVLAASCASLPSRG